MFAFKIFTVINGSDLKVPTLLGIEKRAEGGTRVEVGVAHERDVPTCGHQCCSQHIFTFKAPHVKLRTEKELIFSALLENGDLFISTIELNNFHSFLSLI